MVKTRKAIKGEELSGGTISLTIRYPQEKYNKVVENLDLMCGTVSQYIGMCFDKIIELPSVKFELFKLYDELSSTVKEEYSAILNERKQKMNNDERIAKEQEQNEKDALILKLKPYIEQYQYKFDFKNPASDKHQLALCNVREQAERCGFEKVSDSLIELIYNEIQSAEQIAEEESIHTP